MIEIKMTGMCENCPNADLELDYVRFDMYGDKPGKEWTIRCEHYRACEAMQQKAKGDADT